MTWVAWRQFRTPALVSFAALLGLAIVLGITGPQLVHLFDTTVKPCKAIGDCSTAAAALGNKYNFLQQLLTLLIQVVPALLGLFWGAPLISRELETGTYRLAWTQSVTRTRWLAVKFGLVGSATALLAGLLSLAVTWWYSPLDKVGTNRFDSSIFAERGITPIGYAVFAFAVGALVGLLVRRTLPAMAATVVGFVFVRLVFSELVRQDLLAPVHAAFSLGATVDGFVASNGGPANLVAGAPNLPNAWIYSSRIVDASGRALTPQVTASACPSLANFGPPPGLPPAGSTHHINAVPTAGAQQALQACSAKLSATYHTVVTYQPANRYWTFQSLETAIFVALALALVGSAFWWLRHRVS